ncbi:hypothetical protein [Stomatobaculum longum]|uniref:hypothetical protein n=1 Tax=Stomatobaculum longum TaxID=796942 RepID=UPI0028E83C5E|nr:hypothetical protein [Stomatobaculum longum]
MRYGNEQMRKSVGDKPALFFYAAERADKAGEILLKCKKIRSERMQDLLTERREIAA